MNARRLPPELVQPGVHVRDVMRFQARRGDYGPVTSEADVERYVEASYARLTTPGGTTYERPQDGRQIEFSFKPISDGGILAVFRDITELRQREVALEQARGVMQSVLDNMSDGVTLFDSELSPEVHQPAACRFSPAGARIDRARLVAAGHPAVPSQAR